jgi:VIT1/CCC1 family predicted Fe2+/Mn2+ transporter
LLARLFGPGTVVPLVVNLEHGAFRTYDAQPDAVAQGMPLDERSHARVFRYLSMDRGLRGGVLATLEGRHRAIAGNALRASVLGANDGLVSNMSLVMGVAGAAIGSQAVLVAGLAGLLAGALSMAIGEWISVQSAREMYEHQMRVEADELAEVPEEEKEELALIYQAKGMPEQEALRLATRLLEDPRQALDALAREELGVDPDELGGSPSQAAIASFIFFAIGALIPVLPFVFAGGGASAIASALISALALFGLGAAISLLTGRNPFVSGLRQAAFGLAAAGITYGIGTVVGVSLAG